MFQSHKHDKSQKKDKHEKSHSHKHDKEKKDKSHKKDKGSDDDSLAGDMDDLSIASGEAIDDAAAMSTWFCTAVLSTVNISFCLSHQLTKFVPSCLLDLQTLLLKAPLTL